MNDSREHPSPANPHQATTNQANGNPAVSASTEPEARENKDPQTDTREDRAAKEAAEHSDAKPLGLSDFITVGAAIVSAIATAALAVFAVVQIIIYRRQTRVMAMSLKATARSVRAARRSAAAAEKVIDATAKQVNIAEQGFAFDHRPWIPCEFTPVSGLTFNEQGASLTLRFAIRNVGNAPAMQVFPDVQIATRLDVPSVQREIEDRAKSHAMTRLGFPVFPGNSPAPINIMTHYSREQLEKARVGDSGFVPLHVVGTISYLGLNNRLHGTGFVFGLYRHKPGGPYRLLIDMNEGDVSPDELVFEVDLLTPVAIT